MDTYIETTTAANENVKSCCARLYESDYVKLLLGDSFHPGGMKLTERLGEVLRLHPHSRVLDAASGKGASAIYLAGSFGCEVVGVDYGGDNVRQAREAATAKGLGGRVRFEQGDAERLPFDDATFDAIICECAFCTFPDKRAAAREFARVLKPGGRVGMSDLTRAAGDLPKELDTLLAWVACIADAQSVESYADFLAQAGLRVDCVEPHDEALTEMVNQIRMKLLGAEIMVGLKKMELPGVNFTAAKQMASGALAAIQQGKLGYAIVAGVKG
ncbi:MAG TPA: class I SAM-dependent methyltransferase [Blastocatellia bacterium]|nr:class I SAM-dependent methyltransferase [Blastocatellia bacterium]